jgi:RNA polymerase sigma-70 factor (ECF subfamily)
MSTLAVSGVTRSPLEQELEQLFREHYQMLYRTAYSMLGNAADAEDVPQSIFVRLLRGGMPPEMMKSPKAYLYRAAVNASLNVLRTRKRRRIVGNLEGLEHPAEVFDSVAEEESHRRLAEAIAELSPDAAHILILRYVHSYSDAEIAKLTGTSRGTIAMKLFRIRGRLKKLMRSKGEQR